MASSSYYWARYREKRDEAKEHKKNWKELDKILDDLNGDFDNNVSDTNKKVDACSDKLEDGIREVGSISARQSELSGSKERSPGADGKLSGAIRDLGDEIRELKRRGGGRGV